jgi:signal transduction histidine kinase
MAAPAAVDRERQVIAQQLHDTICQSLSGLQLLARLAERKAIRQYPELAPELGEIQEVVRKASEEVHGLVQSLRAPHDPKPARGAQML